MDFCLKCQNFPASLFFILFSPMWWPTLKGKDASKIYKYLWLKEWQKSVGFPIIRFISKFHTWNINWCISPQPTIWAEHWFWIKGMVKGKREIGERGEKPGKEISSPGSSINPGEGIVSPGFSTNSSGNHCFMSVQLWQNPFSHSQCSVSGLYTLCIL